MIHHVYRVENKSIVRFSLLPGGAVKKAQVLGNRLRLMAFEWTHLACPREVYEEMVERMELKIPLGIDRKEAVARIEKRYGLDGKVGFIHPGMPRVELASLIGEPSETKGNQLTWNTTSNDYHVTVGVRLEKNSVQKLTTNRGLNYLNPVKGTLPWIEDALDDEKSEVSSEDLEKALIKASENLSDEKRRNWCYLATELIEERKYAPEKLRGIAIRHSKGRSAELELFESTSWGGVEKWVGEWLGKILREESETQPQSKAYFGETYNPRARDACSLLNWLNEKDPESAQKFARSYLASGRMAYLEFLIDLSSDFSPDLAEAIILKGFSAAEEKSANYIIGELIEAIPDCSFENNKKILDQLEKLPQLDPKSYWGKKQKEAIDSVK